LKENILEMYEEFILKGVSNCDEFADAYIETYPLATQRQLDVASRDYHDYISGSGKYEEVYYGI